MQAASEFRGLFVGPIVLLALMVIMAIELKLYILPALVFILLLNGIRILMGNATSKIRWVLYSFTNLAAILGK